MPFERSIRIAGTFNFRDIGHYEARDGRHTRPAVLFRSGAIHDLAALRELGVRSVIDLRSASDVERDAGQTSRVFRAGQSQNKALTGFRHTTLENQLGIHAATAVKYPVIAKNKVTKQSPKADATQRDCRATLAMTGIINPVIWQ